MDTQSQEIASVGDSRTFQNVQTQPLPGVMIYFLGMTKTFKHAYGLH
jgi:hypothetical protein